ncbi:MAG: sulfite exporter TauE/SafE family protein [Candidatus Buchananbacteria bacterium]
MPKQIYYIQGMHCASCEINIEQILAKHPGVKKADVSLSKNQLTLIYDQEKPTIEELNKIFSSAGYKFSETPILSQPIGKINLGLPILYAVALIGLFFLLNRLGLKFITNIGAESSLPAFFLFGLLAGVSSCAALIGGLVLSLSEQWLQLCGQSKNFWQKTKPHLLFNTGRLIGFALLGAGLGLIGQKLKISNTISTLLITLVSALMVILALQMLGVKSLQRFRLAPPKNLGKKVANSSFTQGKLMPLIIGFLTLLLPCGFTLVAEGAAVISGSPWRGLLIMTFFALGTLIPLLAIGLFSTKLLLEKNGRINS